MEFERCPMYSSEWEIIDTETLLREVTNELIDMMIWFKATVRTGNAQYRRHIPDQIKDWALESKGV